MSFNPDLEQQEQIAASIQRPRLAMNRWELLAELLVDGGFIAVTAALIALDPPHSLNLGPVLVCVVLLALATRVKFATPFGFTVVTQLAFVPLLFVLPVSLVPVAVVISLLLASLPEICDGTLRPTRLVKRIGDAWFAIGPVAVFVLAGTSPSHAGPWLLLAALCAQFAVDFVASGARFRISDDVSLREHARSSWVFVIDLALSGVALAVAEEVHGSWYAPLAVLPLLGLLAIFARDREARLAELRELNEARIAQLSELNEAYRGTALVLGDVVEADDGYTGEHSKGVVRLCLDVAAKLGLDADQKRNLEFGALLHDVGKIAIPKEIINKPDKLSDHEWTIIKTHTIEGQKLLDTVGGFMREVGLIVRSHHERWDGGGYPDGLAGEAIPLESRIVSACDTWNAMRTDRSYRKRLPFNLAAEEMRAVAGSQLDPGVVTALLEVVADEAEEEQEPGRGQALATSG